MQTTDFPTATGKPPFSFEIPRFSTTASQLVTELNNPGVEVPKVVQLIECEPTVSAKVLKVANSPLYGGSRAVTSIGHAIVLLGFRSVAQQAVAAASGDLYLNQSAVCHAARQETYMQSLAIATIGRFIAGELDLVDPDEAFLCCVVHDIGKLILFDHAGEEYEQLLNANLHGSTVDLENEKYGVCHAVLGRECGNAWQLPASIGSAVANHHLPFDSVSDPLSQCLIVANYLARKWQIGFAEESFCEDALIEAFTAEVDGEENQSVCSEQFEVIREVCLG